MHFSVSYLTVSQKDMGEAGAVSLHAIRANGGSGGIANSLIISTLDEGRW